MEYRIRLKATNLVDFPLFQRTAEGVEIVEANSAKEAMAQVRHSMTDAIRMAGGNTNDVQIEIIDITKL